MRCFIVGLIIIWAIILYFFYIGNEKYFDVLFTSLTAIGTLALSFLVFSSNKLLLKSGRAFLAIEKEFQSKGDFSFTIGIATLNPKIELFVNNHGNNAANIISVKLNETSNPDAIKSIPDYKICPSDNSFIPARTRLKIGEYEIHNEDFIFLGILVDYIDIATDIHYQECKVIKIEKDDKEKFLIRYM